jgi:hypothetical protein
MNPKVYIKAAQVKGKKASVVKKQITGKPVRFVVRANQKYTVYCRLNKKTRKLVVNPKARKIKRVKCF